MCNECGSKKKTGGPDAYSNTQDLQALTDALNRGGIQNLTINNYGSISILGGNVERANTALIPRGGLPQPGQVEILGSWMKAKIQVMNATEGPLAKIALTHTYNRGNNSEDHTWENVGAGQLTDAWEVNFWDGWWHGDDNWKLVIIPDAGFKYEFLHPNGWKGCNLSEKDQSSNGPTVFTILKKREWHLGLRSGGCDAEYFWGNGGISAFCWIRIRNKMSRTISDIHLDHITGYVDTNKMHWNQTLEPGQVTDLRTVFFVSPGPIPDYPDKWNIQLMRQGNTNPHKNKKQDKWCSLNENDAGRIREIVVNDDGWELAFDGEPCKDGWEDMA